MNYEKASTDLKRYLPLKLATLAWLFAVLSVAAYGVAATWARWWPYGALRIADLNEAEPVIYAFFAGLAGSALYCLRGFYWAVSPQSETDRRYQYDPNWTLWYVTRPPMGAFLGVFSYAALRAGVATLGSASRDAGASAAYGAIAFLAGFAATEVLNWITVTARRVFDARDVPPGSPRWHAETNQKGEPSDD